MKKMTSLLSILILLIVIATGCSKKMEYTHVIPSDAYVVGSADLVALFEKSGLLTDSKTAKDKILTVLQHGISADAFKQVEKILTSPNESGLDLKARIYMFTAENFTYPVWVVKVDNESKLTTTLDLLAKEQFSEPIAKGDGYSYAIIDKNKIIAYNQYTAIITASSTAYDINVLEAAISKLMKQNETNSIDAIPAFEKMRKEHEDIDFMASLAAVPEIYSQQLKSSLLAPHLNLKEISAIGKLNFDRGKVVLKFEYYTENKAIQELLDKQVEATKELSREFLGFFPESCVAFASVGANGKAMYSLILDNKDLRDIMPSADSEVAKEVFDAFDGDISIAITDVKMDASSSFLAYAQVNSTNILNVLYDNKDAILGSGQQVTKIGDNEYMFEMSNFKAYYGIKGTTMYATNDIKYLDNICKDVSPSLKQASFEKDLRGKNFFIIVNIKSILELPMIKALASMGGDEYLMYYHLASKIDYFEMSNSIHNVSEMKLILQDKDTNALKQIVDFARQFIGM